MDDDRCEEGKPVAGQELHPTSGGDQCEVRESWR